MKRKMMIAASYLVMYGQKLQVFSPYPFLRFSDDNYVKVEIHGKQKLALGLVVPAKYNTFTAKRRTTKILDPELSKRKELFVSLEFLDNEKKVIIPFSSIYQD